MSDYIKSRLFELRDEKYKDFQAKLMPTVPPEKIIGVRTPAVRSLAKELCGTPEAEKFISCSEHEYYEENNLHAFLISLTKDFSKCARRVNALLPYIDNWATCDTLSPAVFSRHPEELLGYITRWIASDHPYTVRFAIGMLMRHFLDDRFDDRYPAMVAAVRSDEYYVRMMAAWYFATALAKQYAAVLPYITEHRLDPWVNNKAIQKARESRRISPEQKDLLNKYRI